MANNIPNAPGMPVNPNLHDISRYNLWAARYGQPFWGANAAPQPAAPQPAAPAPQPKRRPGWQKGRPRGRPPPAPHGQIAAEPGDAHDGWRPGTVEEGKKTYAYRTNGRRLVVRIYNSITGTYRVTPNGEDYYKNNRQEFIVRIPAIFRIRKLDTDGRPVTHDIRRTYVPITEERLEGPDVVRHNLRGAMGAGRVRDRLSGPEEAKAYIAEGVQNYVNGIMDTDREGDKILLLASEGYYVYDPSRPIEFSEEIVRHIREDGTPVIEYILNRPLQGFPALPPNMYQKLGLCEIATHDLKDRGGCMVAQIYECANKRHRINGKQENGVRGKPTNEMQKVFKDPKEIEDLFDKIFAELYPGDAVDPDTEDLDTSGTKRAYPYEFEGWREIGVNTLMVERLCQLKNMAARVVRDRALIFSFDPVSKVDTRAKTLPVLVYNIWGDHAFFYATRDAKDGVSHLMKKEPFITQKLPETRLKIDERYQEDGELFSEMEHFDSHQQYRINPEMPEEARKQLVDEMKNEPFEKFKLLKTAIAAKESRTWYAYADEIEDLRQELEKDPDVPGFHVKYGVDAEKISSIIFVDRSKKDKNKNHKSKLKIRVVPDNANELQFFCEEFEKQTGLRLPYRGESEAVVMHRATLELLVYRRKFVPPALREAISRRFKGKCACCGDSYGNKFDVDHIRPLREGGLDHESNMQPLCRQCHNKKCELEENACPSTRLNAIQSELSPEMLNIFHLAPKPKQVYWGGPRPSSTVVSCIDAISCRENALVDNEDALPCMSPLDAPELCHDEYGDLKHEAMYWDYLYVAIADGDDHDRFPYTGRRWYWKGAVRYMLETRRIEPRHLLAGIRATNHVSPSALGDAFKTLKKIMGAVAQEFPMDSRLEVSEQEIRSRQKGAILALIGLWNITEQAAWQRVKSSWETDAGGPVRRRRQLEDGQFEFLWSVDILSLKSMRPIGQIALDMEQVRVAEILAILKPFEQSKALTRYGAVVDCVFFDLKSSFIGLDIVLKESTLPSGAPKFKIKREPVQKVPVQRDLAADNLELLQPSLGELAVLFLELVQVLESGTAGDDETACWQKILKVMKLLKRKMLDNDDELRMLNRTLAAAQDEAFKALLEAKREVLVDNKEALAERGIEIGNLDQAMRHAVSKIQSGSAIRHHELSFDPLEWLTVTDPSIEDLVELLEERHGALVNGPAGTGKTWSMRKAIKMLKRKLKAQGIELRNLNCALRHAAARLIDGSTIAHVLNKYRLQGGPKNAKQCILLIDEASEIPLCMWTELAQWYLLGVRFIIIGDFDGQFLPMFDRWGAALKEKDIQTSLFFHSLCEGTRVLFTQYRRGDASAKPLFDFYCGLYPRLKFENQQSAVNVSLEEAQLVFKKCEATPDIMLCLSHKKRMLLNHAVNMQISRQLELEGVETKLVPKTSSRTEGVTMAPQDFRIWKGMELLGCIRQSNSKTVVNGVWYVVEKWDERFVHLNVHERYRKQPGDDTDDEAEIDEEEEDVEDDPAEGEIPAELKLTYDNVSKWLRPMHALCYGSIQGCTMADKRILLLDTQKAHFTLRHLIVGVSRGTHQDKVHVATAEYERGLMQGARMYSQAPLQGGRDTFEFDDAEFEQDDSQDLALYSNEPTPDLDADIDAFLSGAVVEDEVDSDGDLVM